MRTLPAPLAAHLATGTTTLATCWRLMRRDGVVMGFTDHDRDLSFDGVTFLAATGFEGSEVASELGLAVSGGEVSGAIRADGITETDLEAGLYDAATIETLLVNWSDLTQRVTLTRHTVGEVRRSDHAFTVELRSPAYALNQPQGRLFAAACDADLGDGRCGVALTGALAGAGTVTGTDGRLMITASGLAAPAGRYAQGRLLWTQGPNAGRAVEIRAHRVAGSVATLELWRPTVAPIVAGHAFTVTAGCDKRFATCRDVFVNTLNFRGFPHIPGNDRALAVARPGAANNGASLMR